MFFEERECKLKHTRKTPRKICFPKLFDIVKCIENSNKRIFFLFFFFFFFFFEKLQFYTYILTRECGENNIHEIHQKLCVFGMFIIFLNTFMNSYHIFQPSPNSF